MVDLRLQQHLGKDLAPHVLAGEVARKLKTEAHRLGSQAAATAELAAAAAQDGVRRECMQVSLCSDFIEYLKVLLHKRKSEGAKDCGLELWGFGLQFLSFKKAIVASF